MKNYYLDRYSYQGSRDIRVDYKSLEMFIADISTDDYPRVASQKKGDSWSGSKSIRTSIDEAREGVDLGQVELGVIKNESLHDIINRAVYAVAGGTVDIGKFLTGEPECMIDFQSEDAPRFVTLNADICENAGTESSVFRRKAIAIACLVDELENNGFRVRLNVMCNIDFKMTGCFDRLVGLVTIKDYHHKLSIAQITGCLSQGFFRRLMFCFIEKHCPVCPDDFSYGRPGTDYSGIEGVILKNTRNGMSLNSEEDIRRYVDKYTTDIYELSSL